MLLTIIAWILVIIAVLVLAVVFYLGPTRIRDAVKAQWIMDKDPFFFESTKEDVIDVFSFASSQQRRRAMYYIESKKYGKLRHYLNECLRIHDEWKSGQ